MHRNQATAAHIHLKGKTISFQRPKVMAILNLTPDSFYAGSRTDGRDLIARAGALLASGADLLDLGGQSTRPGSVRISADEEMDRVIPAIEVLLKELPDCLISIDTFYSEVARAAVEAGACMVNDISGGQLDAAMFETVAKLQVPYVLTHIQGQPQSMQDHPHYTDVVGEVKNYFQEKIGQLHALGVKEILLDPGFGFGKTKEHNLQLLAHLAEFTAFECPLLIGFSRKKTIRDLLSVTTEDALNGTTVMNTIALMQGAAVIRVHDPLEAAQAVTIIRAVQDAY